MDTGATRGAAPDFVLGLFTFSAYYLWGQSSA